MNSNIFQHLTAALPHVRIESKLMCTVFLDSPTILSISQQNLKKKGIFEKPYYTWTASKPCQLQNRSYE